MQLCHNSLALKICCFEMTCMKKPYPLLLYVDHSIMDCNKDMLRIHVVHEPAGCENLQYTLYRREKILLSGNSLEVLSKYIPRNSLTIAVSQVYCYPNLLALHAHLWQDIRTVAWAYDIIHEDADWCQNKTLTCMNNRAPATSTKMTLLQSINTAWTSPSAISALNKWEKPTGVICLK